MNPHLMNRMNLRSHPIAILAFFLVAFVLVGCGGGAGDPARAFTIGVGLKGVVDRIPGSAGQEKRERSEGQGPGERCNRTALSGSIGFRLHRVHPILQSCNPELAAPR